MYWWRAVTSISLSGLLDANTNGRTDKLGGRGDVSCRGAGPVVEQLHGDGGVALAYGWMMLLPALRSFPLMVTRSRPIENYG